MKKIMISLLLAIPFICAGQFTMSGKIIGPDGPVPFTTVVINNSNAEFVKGTVTDIDGFFELELEKGRYQLKVNHMNYNGFQKDINLVENLSLETIELTGRVNELTEVVVTAETPKIRQEIDKTIVNIEKSPIASTGSLFDALKNAPGVLVQNDQVNILGKNGVVIAIEGRRVRLSGEDLNNFLKSLPANDIKEIEIITNPSAKYEAEGNSGVINIVYKKIKRNAWRNSFSATHNQAKFGWHSLRNNFNYQKNKFSFLLNTSYNFGAKNVEQRSRVDFQNPLELVTIQKIKPNDIVPRVLLDYSLNETTKIGVQYLGTFDFGDISDSIHTTIFNANSSVDNFLIADAETDRENINNSLNFYFDKKLDTLGRRITFNFDYLQYDGNRESNILSNRFDPDLNFVTVDFANKGIADQFITNYNAKVDIEHPMKIMNFSYGANVSFSETNYELANFNTITGTPILIPEQSNKFDFLENIQAVYINGYKRINERWEIQLGLRSEYTQTEGISEELPDPIKREYLQVFPTFYTSFKKNENHMFMLNYGRRINRPNYSQLNPARYFINSKVSSQGNPFLLPSYNNNIEFTHIFKNNLRTRLSFSNTTDASSVIFDLDNATGEQIVQFDNFYTAYNYSLLESYQWKPTSWWRTYTTLYFSYSDSKKIDPEEDVELRRGFGYYGSINNTLTLNKARTIFGEISFWYDGPYNSALFGYEEANSLDIAFTFRSIVKGMNLTIGGYDLFNASQRRTNSTVNNINQSYISYPSNRFVRVSMTYNFGNNDISTRERNFGNEDVRRRSN